MVDLVTYKPVAGVNFLAIRRSCQIGNTSL